MDSEPPAKRDDEAVALAPGSGGVDRFKADRDELRAPEASSAAAGSPATGPSEAALRARLATLPGWELVREGRILQRRYRVPHFRAALAFAAFVGEVAQDGPVEPEIVLGLDSVQVRLSAPESERVGDRHFGFASAIDFTDG